ncbi:hypothetical protein CDL12_06471 [Handroanthus impetiginosus]|uniref:Uncharacterized protein n=1 Tax=Handroanthus impetiginosus TaxID=429701 RepID=A0A2G9HTQ1_9LAMI|nr:hypothetical protein CDL12_06471 [Handroanthus impetiginosus]
MKSLSKVGLGLSLVFGCLLLALIAELYYLLWWKKKIITKTINPNGNQNQIPSQKSHFHYIFPFWKKPTSSTSQQSCSSSTLVHEPQSSHPNKALSLKPFEQDQTMENFQDLPRFLFTITEETREDLESEDGISKITKQSTSRSNLSDLLQILETPFLTPPCSPPYFTPPLTPSFSNHQQQIFGPFLESEQSSPPPKFKFLRDAEEKLIQRRKKDQNIGKNEENGSFIRLIVEEKEEEEEVIWEHRQSRNSDMEKGYFSSSSSQVLPMVSCPPTFKSKFQQQTQEI